jgi:Ser/Thr protein kinase RdoA (MazF antagonist)
MYSSHEIEAIVCNYPAECRPMRIEPLGMAGGMSGAQFWRVDSLRGTLALRRWPAEHPTPERLQFIHQVLFYAAARGITFLAVPIRTVAGESFVASAGYLWELAAWMPGSANYNQSPTQEKLSNAMTALAQFHLAVHDFALAGFADVAGAGLATSRHLSRLKELSKRESGELYRAISDRIWPELGPLARQFLETLPGRLPLAIQQLEALGGVTLALQPCLRDIWHDHVLFTGDSVTGVIDFGGVNIDTPATDIARLLGSLAGIDGAAWREGLAAYSRARPLSTDEECAAMALDASGTILAGCNWLRWIYIEERRFEDRPQVIERIRQIVQRCEMRLE